MVRISGSFNKESSSFLQVAALLLIIFSAILAFYPVIWNGFVNYDDNVYIYENSQIREFSFSQIFNFFTGNVEQFPPLVMSLFSLLYHFFGYNPLPFHMLSLGLHLLNSILVFFFIYRFDKQWLTALIAGLLFGLHPLHVESVAWATELKDVLYSLFFLAGLIVYQSPHTRRNLFLVFLFFLLACFSKGMAVVFPLALLLIDYYRSGVFNWIGVIRKWPYFLFSLFWGAMVLVTQHSVGLVQGNGAISVFERVFIASGGFLFYLIKLVVPYDLAAFYPVPLTPGGDLPFYLYLAPLGLAAIVLVCVRAGSFRKLLIFGLLFFLINLILVLQFLPVGLAMAADRYSYLSSVGFFFIVAYFINFWSQKSPAWQKSLIFLTAIILIFHGYLTRQQVYVWQNSITLWNKVLDQPGPYRDYALAYTNRGDAHTDLNNFDAAIQDYDRALELNTDYVDAYNNRGLVKGLRQQYAEAKADFDAALRIRPDFAKAYNNRGNANRFLGDAQAALDDFTKAIAIKPDYLDAYINRGVMLYLVGDTLAACRDWKKVRDAGSGAADQLLKDYCK